MNIEYKINCDKKYSSVNNYNENVYIIENYELNENNTDRNIENNIYDDNTEKNVTENYKNDSK